MSWLRSIGSRLREIVKRLRRSGRNPGNEPAGRIPDMRLETLIERAGRQHVAFNKKIDELGDLYWRVGWRDASSGQPRAQFEGVARTTASLLKQNTLARYQSDQQSFDEERNTKTGAVTTARERLTKARAWIDELQLYWLNHPRAVSRILRATYLCIAVALIIADIPLALKLTQIGFDLDLADTEALELRHLGVNFIGVVLANWEVFILATGIALCAVYLKIYCDRWVVHPPQNVGTNSSGVSSSPTSLTTGWFSHVILGLTLLTIFSLGMFRYSAVQESETGEFTWQIFITCATFILVTLLFPVIGGICLSLGLSHWHNRRPLKLARKEQAKAAREYDRATEALQKLLAPAANWEALLTWLQTAEFLDTIAEFLLGYYRHGYERGWMDRVASSRSPIDAAEILRAGALARRIAVPVQGEPE